jgi:hypothetical protein
LKLKQVAALCRENGRVGLYDVVTEGGAFRQWKAPATLNFDDADQTEQITDPIKLHITYGDNNLIPLKTVGGLEFIQSKFLAPLSAIMQKAEIYTRKSLDGQIYFAVKVGLLIEGIIMPYNAFNKNFAEMIETVASETWRIYNRNATRDATEPPQDLETQYSADDAGEGEADEED